MNRCSKYALVLLILVMAGSGIMWIVSSQWRQNNNSIDLLKVQCTDICSSSYSYTDSYNRCCYPNLPYCKNKVQCQQDLDSYYSHIQNTWTVIFITSGICTFLVNLCICNQQRKKRANQQRYLLIQPNIRNNGIQPRANARSSPILNNIQQQLNANVDQRLRDSFSVRDSKNICPVCFQAYDDSKALMLKCGHLFHSKCIRDWAKKQSNCPLCRGEV